MKVLFIQSYLGHNKYFPVYPLGLAYISTASYQKGHKVQIFDPNTSVNPYEDLAKCILNFSPQIIGISLRNIDNQYRIAPFYYYKYFQNLLEKVNRMIPHAKIIVGGAGFSMFAEKIMERNPLIDFGIYLEGEESFPELLDNLNKPESVHGIYIRQEKRVLFTGFRQLPDFRKLPIPKRDFVNIAPYLNHGESLGIQTRRGCPLKCTYCNYPQLNGNILRIREVKDICDEIEYMERQYHIKQFMFADGVFNVPLEHSIALCEEIIKRGLKARWSAWMELKHISKNFLLLAIKAGCTNITFSPDAVSQSALNSLQKELNEKDIKDSLKLFIRDKDLRGLNVTYSIFVNPPGETFTGILKTILFYLKAKLCLRGRGGPFLNWIRLEPETKTFQYALKKGIIPKNIDLLPNNESGLKNMFYTNPSLRHFDFLIIVMLKFLPMIKKLAPKRHNQE